MCDQCMNFFEVTDLQFGIWPYFILCLTLYCSWNTEYCCLWGGVLPAPPLSGGCGQKHRKGGQWHHQHRVLQGGGVCCEEGEWTVQNSLLTTVSFDSMYAHPPITLITYKSVDKHSPVSSCIYVAPVFLEWCNNASLVGMAMCDVRHYYNIFRKQFYLWG